MAMQAIFNWDHVTTPWSSLSLPSSSPLMFAENIKWKKKEKKGNEKDEGSGRGRYVCAASSSNSTTPSPNYWDWWKPDKGAPAPCLSDILWPSAGAFAAMAILGKVDQLLSPKGLSMTIAPLGAVSAVLFATPNAPGARKYNMFVAQMGCAAIGVLALSAFGPGWLARSAALAASIGFMIWTRSVHPPAASLPIMFIDGSKFHRLHLWYALFPGAAGCILLCLIQEMVSYLKDNYKF
ncbi:transmembrane protein [Cinnamomum micranthum f. kanehirae]|uniref:Transmembrane protein n=1 Tax=Cinnamomum micranthum f. kanehirae TaxID=337451 RepID=A0A3S3MD37_9MAGN|nr:transmembrane protein [Cinnamomum micranthum f. kanehirae]